MRRPWDCFAVTAALLAFSPLAAAAQPVTLESLAGLRIDGAIHVTRNVRFPDRTFSQRTTYSYSVQPGPANRISHSQTNTYAHPDGKAPLRQSWSGAAALGVPHSFRDGQAVWIFEDSSLVRLRTLGEGGAKLVIKLTRGAGGDLTCTIRTDFAREDGVGKLVSTSTTNGQRMQILSEKPLSSECRVSR